jgi:hypothetical protein
MSLTSRQYRCRLYKKTRPIRRTIAAVLKGSLSKPGNAGVTALAHKITNIYSWSIDSLKLKGDRLCHFTERFINDSVYDGADNLEAAFFYIIIYAFAFAQNSSGKIGYYDEDGRTLKNFFQNP